MVVSYGTTYTHQVYDLHESNSWLQHVGLGMYHSGLEVGGVEYTFSEAGIGQHPPRQIADEGVSYKTTEVGVCCKSARNACCIYRPSSAARRIHAVWRYVFRAVSSRLCWAAISTYSSR